LWGQQNSVKISDSWLQQTMVMHLLAAAGCVCIVLALCLQQFLVIAALKRLLAEERERNAETTSGALRMLEASFAARIRRLEACTEQTENGIEAVRRHRTGAAERSAPRNTVHSRAGVADGWMNASSRDMRDMDAGAPRNGMAAPAGRDVPVIMQRRKLHETSARSTSPRSSASHPPPSIRRG
jgi:hypothetical protein